MNGLLIQKHDPKDVLINIALAAIVLKRATDDEAFQKLGENSPNEFAPRTPEPTGQAWERRHPCRPVPQSAQYAGKDAGVPRPVHGEVMRDLEQNLIRTAPPEQALQFAFIHGIFFALVGNRAESASHFRRLLAADPENKEYQAAYDPLGR